MKRMAKIRFQTTGVLLAVCFFAGVTMSSCAPKYGCPVNEETHVDFEKTKGKRGKTQLFDKKMSKRMRG